MGAGKRKATPESRLPIIVEGPYRDLGSGFARLSGSEAPRRAPSAISHVEDALTELLRNARDADAKNIYVASKLRNRRYRTLTVIDDGRGVPEAYTDLIFEPGVTTRHLNPIMDSNHGTPPHEGTSHKIPHGAGIALHHIKNAAVEAKVFHANSPTAIRVTFDTRTLPERTLQSETRPSRSNLLATVKSFAKQNPRLNLFHASPANILATLLENHIIQRKVQSEVLELAGAFGLEVSSKTVRRILGGEVGASKRVGDASAASAVSGGMGGGGTRGSGEIGGLSDGRSLVIGEEERAEIAAILSRAARASYLEVLEVKFRSRPGEVSVVARVHEPEDEYE